MADSTAEVLFIETTRLKDFCTAMRNELSSVFADVDAINQTFDDFGKTWEGEIHDTFYLLFEDTKKDAANAKAQWETVLEEYEQASAAYIQLEQRIESLGTSQG